MSDGARTGSIPQGVGRDARGPASVILNRPAPSRQRGRAALRARTPMR